MDKYIYSVYIHRVSYLETTNRKARLSLNLYYHSYIILNSIIIILNSFILYQLTKERSSLASPGNLWLWVASELALEMSIAALGKPGIPEDLLKHRRCSIGRSVKPRQLFSTITVDSRIIRLIIHTEMFTQ